MRAVVVVISSMLLAAACGNPFGADSDDASAGLVTSALEDLPRITTDDALQFRIADFNAIAELLDLGSEPAEGRVRSLMLPSPRSEGGPGFIVAVPDMFRFSGDDGALQAEAGFTLDDVQRVAEVTSLPHTATVIIGPETWGGLAEPLGDGVSTIGQGEDLRQDPDLRTSLDTLGRPIRVAEADGVLASSFSTPVMQGWLDGSGARYIDNDRLASMATELDRYDVVTAMLFFGGSFRAMTPIDLDATMEEFEEQISQTGELTAISQPFIAVGIGNTIVDGRAIEVVTYLFATEESAEAAMASIETVWTVADLASSGEPVSAVAELNSIERNGVVVTVVVTVPDDRVARALNMMSSRDAPLSHS